MKASTERSPMLWLSEDVPALLSGARPQSLVEMGLPTNPVHILDLGFFLPAVIVTGVLLLKRTTIAYTVAPAMIVFLLLTGMPILLTPVVQTVRREAAAWGVVGPIGALIVISLAMLIWLLSTMRSSESPAGSGRAGSWRRATASRLLLLDRTGCGGPDGHRDRLRVLEAMVGPLL